MAVTTALVVGTGLAVKGAIDSRQAIKESGRVQAEVAGENIEESRRQFDVTQESLRPAIEAGDAAREQQRILLGLGPSVPGEISAEDARAQAFENLQESPGQQFLRRRAERAITRNAARIGGLGGGNVRTALQENAIGLAQTDLDNQFARLGQIAGQGTAATTNVARFGAGSVIDQASQRTVSADARASGVLAGAQLTNQVGGQFLNLAGQFAGGGAFSRPPTPKLPTSNAPQFNQFAA